MYFFLDFDNMNLRERTFWIGLFPGIGTDHVQYVAETVRDFLAGKRG